MESTTTTVVYESLVNSAITMITRTVVVVAQGTTTVSHTDNTATVRYITTTDLCVEGRRSSPNKTRLWRACGSAPAVRTQRVDVTAAAYCTPRAYYVSESR